MKTIKERRAEISKLLGEAKAIEEKHDGKPMPQNDADKHDELCTEAKAIQDTIDRETNRRDLEAKAREGGDDVLPGDEDVEAKGKAGGAEAKLGNGTGHDGSPVVGVIPLGEAFVKSEAFRNFLENGMPQGQSQAFQVPSLVRAKHLVVTKKMIEAKAIPDADALIQPMRTAEIVRTTEHERLSIRDVMPVRPTASNSIEYVVLDSWTRAAAETAHSAQKPEGGGALVTATAPIRTVAVHVPVTEQQLMDAPQLQGIIEDELTFDLERREEEVVVWGDGTAPNLLGIMNTPGVSAIAAGRIDGADTKLDILRRMRTDVSMGGYIPNSALLHPLDWEDIVLLKGTDNRYVWVVVTDRDGNERVWALNVVESVAMQDSIGGDTTPQRVMMVGDFVRLATLYDRQQANVAVGWINDQFIRNQRTIRAEERIGIAVKRPNAVRYYETQAAVV